MSQKLGFDPDGMVIGTSSWRDGFDPVYSVDIMIRGVYMATAVNTAAWGRHRSKI